MARSATNQPSASDRQGRAAATQSGWPRGWSPLQPGSSQDADEDRFWLEREMTLLERALDDKGEMQRRQLGDLVGCKYWGPRRFTRALKAATEQGRIKHTGFGRYGPADSSSS